MKLEGLRVIDLSMFLPGPHLTMMMADHGAEVIRVEPPGGEPARHYGPFQEGHSVWFRNTHRGKKSICLNLKDDVDRKSCSLFVKRRMFLLRRLGRVWLSASALIMKRYNRVTPKLYIVPSRLLDKRGPLSAKATHDMGAQALAGLLAINDGGDGKPVVPGLPGADMGSSLAGLAGILMALYRRETTGEGDYVDATMYDTLLSWTAHLTGSVFAKIHHQRRKPAGPLVVQRFTIYTKLRTAVSLR